MSAWSRLEYVKCCSICGSSQIRDVNPKTQIVQCQACGFIFVSPRPTQQDIINFAYGENHYQVWIKENKTRFLMWQKRVNFIKKLKPHGTLMDVGCGLGMFVDIAAKEGYSVTGLDSSRFACEYARSHYNFNDKIHLGSLETVDLGLGQFDIITLWHVLEHVPDPRSALERVYHLLKDDGVVVIAVPNISNWKKPIKKLLQIGEYYQLHPYDEIHLSHFNLKTLSYLLEQAGYHVLDKGVDDYYASPNVFTEVRHAMASLMMNYHLPLSSTLRIVAKKRLANASEANATPPESRGRWNNLVKVAMY